MTFPIIGITPWHWHVFGLFWHTAAAISLWWLIRLIWPKHKDPALWAGLLFAVYPGFVLQPISITFGHIFLVYTAYFLSTCFLILAYQHPKRFWLFTFIALLTSAINLLCMEYFLLLHLLQPVVLFFVFQQETPEIHLHLKLVIKAWWPYFILFSGNLIWRTVFFKYQTHNYGYLFLDRIYYDPGMALIYLIKTMLKDLWNTSVVAWIRVFKMPFSLEGNKIDFVYLVVSLAAALFFFIFILRCSQWSQNDQDEKGQVWQMLALGTLALFIAGAPFWLTELNVSQTGFSSRFSLPFIFGAVLVLSSILYKVRKLRWVVSTFLAITIGLSIGYQFQIINDFRREWIVQKNLLWQLAWRIPDLEPGTTIFISEMPKTQHISHTILSSMVDWNFKPEPTSRQMDYGVYYPGEIIKNIDITLKPETPFQFDHLGAVFNGNTSKNITILFSKDDSLIVNCAHVISSFLAKNNPSLSNEEESMALLSDPGLIDSNNVFDSNQLFPEIFGNEPEPTHCYYFEKVDLANQQHNWQLAIEIFNRGTINGDSNWVDTELVPIIESYAHLGEWEKAYSYSIVMASRSYYPVSTVICAMWNELATNTPDGLTKHGSLKAISVQFGCQF